MAKAVPIPPIDGMMVIEQKYTTLSKLRNTLSSSYRRRISHLGSWNELLIGRSHFSERRLRNENAVISPCCASPSILQIRAASKDCELSMNFRIYLEIRRSFCISVNGINSLVCRLRISRAGLWRSTTTVYLSTLVDFAYLHSKLSCWCRLLILLLEKFQAKLLAFYNLILESRKWYWDKFAVLLRVKLSSEPLEIAYVSRQLDIPSKILPICAE